ncbi:MAG: DNA starvation/stationary phase protection protein [Ignavibacteriaceae bacterium]|nr:DNA starvation/stationary phase protection protein [Ignavibacteriaceae bacterium]
MTENKTQETAKLTADLLTVVLADEVVLYTKARNYHWNVKGIHFFGLHSLFEKIYDELAEDIDNIAERILTLGYNAPGTMTEFLKLSSIKEHPGQYPEATVMVQNFLEDYESVTNKINRTAKKVQDEFADDVTAGMLFGLVEKYQKTAWMIKSVLK